MAKPVLTDYTMRIGLRMAAAMAVAGVIGQAQVSNAASANGNSATYTPQTSKERLTQFVLYELNPVAVLASMATAGWGQLRDRPREWREGATGYGDRLASSYAEHVIRGFLLYGAAEALHEDNRYVPLREGGFFRRLEHAMEGPFVARHPDGTRHVSISNTTALAGSALISRAWQPRSTDSPKLAFESMAGSIGIDIGIDVFREFGQKR